MILSYGFYIKHNYDGLVISTWSDYKIFVFTKEGMLLATFGSKGHDMKKVSFSFPVDQWFHDADGYLLCL